MNGWLAILGQTATGGVGLTTGGLVVMTVSVVLVLGLMIFCMSQILGEKSPTEHHHAPLDIDTRDRD